MSKEILLAVLQWMATGFGLLQGLLILLKRKENWAFLLAQSVTYVVWALGSNLYADVVEQSIYILLSILGFSIWYQKFRNKLFDVNIHHISLRNGIDSVLVLVILSAGFYIWLKYTNDPAPLLDAVTTGIGFVATFLMARKVVECWALWLISDILGCIIYFNLSAPGLTILNFIWTFMAIGSYITWHKETKNYITSSGHLKIDNRREVQS